MVGHMACGLLMGLHTVAGTAGQALVEEHSEQECRFGFAVLLAQRECFVDPPCRRTVAVYFYVKEDG